MLYAISRRVRDSQSYVSVEPGGLFSYGTLNEATAFQFIADAIDAIVCRVKQIPDWSSEFTIVGVKPVSTPRYEEVIL